MNSRIADTPWRCAPRRAAKRCGRGYTQVGSEGKKESSPAEVAKQGIEALLDGKDHVYAASMTPRIEGILANVTPGSVKGAMHEKMAKTKTAGS
jgi:hypothetical protein